jgi:hypothetical protein
MKKVMPLLLGGFLLVSTVACNNAKTTSDAPNATNNSGQVPNTQEAQTAKNDATNDVRKKQIESDIRAREQRNDAGGNQDKRTDGDLQSEVRGKLEANIPNSKLTVDSKEGVVTVAGLYRLKHSLPKLNRWQRKLRVSRVLQ